MSLSPQKKKWIRGTHSPKIMIYLKRSQASHKGRPTGEMTSALFIYKSSKVGTKLKFLDSLSQLYIPLGIRTHGAEPNLSLKVTQNKGEIFPDETTKSANLMCSSIKKISLIYLTLWTANWSQIYRIILPWNATSRHHLDLLFDPGNTWGCLLYDLLEARCWWATMCTKY